EEHKARVRTIRKPDAPLAPMQTPLFLAVERARTVRRPLRLQPSTAETGMSFTAGKRINLGVRIPIKETPEMDALGQAIHAFMAADRPETELDVRCAKARFVIERWEMTNHIAPESLVEAADRLWAALSERYPGARIRREVPVFATLGSQVVAGRVDLLVEGEDYFAIIDHKSFPGRQDLSEKKAIQYGSQLDLYERAIAAATGKTCVGLFVHLPVVGAVIEVRRGPAAVAEALVPETVIEAVVA
ncbi:PD-(D/E)XK nuclease family protein, partial [Heyndrickxia sporothermodurans]